jgi:hypothetical protein
MKPSDSAVHDFINENHKTLAKEDVDFQEKIIKKLCCPSEMSQEPAFCEIVSIYLIFHDFSWT